MTDLADRKNSVTRQDFVSSPDQGVWAWSIFDPGAVSSPLSTLPIHGSRGGDMVLAATLDLEDMWASAIAKAVTKIAVRGYEISDSDDSTRRTEYGQSMIRNLDGPARYREGVVKTVTDFLTTDNGWFIEVARAGNKPAGKVLGLYHLDSFRCYRTGNLDYPVLYVDWEGGWHKLRGDQVIFGADMPSPRARLWGIGRCAARRAFQTITTLSATKTYFREKITGSRALTLYFITGVSRTQLQDAMETSEAEKIRKGHVIYKGAVMIPIQSDQPINVAPLDLAGVADGFNVDQVEKSSLRTYAIAIGLNPDELVERAAGLNSGSSAQVSEQAAEEAGGLPYFVKDLEDKLNFLVMPKQTIFQVKTNDIRDQQQKAVLNKTKVDTIVAMMGTPQAPGILSQEMALQMAVDEGLVPTEFLPQDVTPQGTLTDSGDQSKALAATPRAPYAGQLPAAQPQLPATKASPEHTGVMIALYPDATAAKAIAAQSGVTEPIEEMHLTLAFLGDSSETPLSSNKNKLIAMVKQWAAEKGQALKGTINGLGRFFHAEDDETNAVFVSPDVPGLPELRQSLCDWIEQSGFDYAQNHGFTPHITVAYVPLKAPTPPIRVETPVTFDKVTLAWGDERYEYRMAAGNPATKAKDDDWEEAVKWAEDASQP